MKIENCFIFFIFLFLIPKESTAIQAVEKPGIVETQRSFDPEFKERYKGNNYNYNRKGIRRRGNTNAKGGDDAPYQDKIPNDREERSNQNFTFGNTGLFMPIAIGVLIFAVIYLVYALLNDGNSLLFTRKRSKKIQEEISATAIIKDHDLDFLIKKAEEDKNYRLAIRYNYLAVLKKMASQGVILYEDEKTNSEYQNEIKDQKLHKQFSYVSYLYNYIWYGEFYVTQKQYINAKNDFNLLR